MHRKELGEFDIAGVLLFNTVVSCQDGEWEFECVFVCLCVGLGGGSAGHS